MSVDAGAIVDGWHGDAARTFYVGEPAAGRAPTLIDLTREAMMAGIAAAVPGNHIDDISAAVEAVARTAGLGIIRQFVGHGIGTEMHEEPQVPNYRTGRPGRKLEPGLCLAIEPMFTLGGWDTGIEADDWTVVTADGSLAAHFEHSIAITDDGPQHPDGRMTRPRGCRNWPSLIRYAFVCRPGWADTACEKGKHTHLWPSVTRSKSKERSSSRFRTPCSRSSWRTATGCSPTSAASCA